MSSFAVNPSKDDEEPCFWKGMWQKLNTMRSIGQLCDVVLVPEDCSTSFMAHSSVLAASSGVFFDYFTGASSACSLGLEESAAPQKLRLTDMSTATLKVTLDFIYGVVPNTRADFERLLSGGRWLRISGAETFCRRLLKLLNSNDAIPRETQRRNVSAFKKQLLYRTSRALLKDSASANAPFGSSRELENENKLDDNSTARNNVFKSTSNSSFDIVAATTFQDISQTMERVGATMDDHALADISLEDMVKLQCPHLRKLALSGQESDIVVFPYHAGLDIDKDDSFQDIACNEPVRQNDSGFAESDFNFDANLDESRNYTELMNVGNEKTCNDLRMQPCSSSVIPTLSVTTMSTISSHHQEFTESTPSTNNQRNCGELPKHPVKIVASVSNSTKNNLAEDRTNKDHKRSVSKLIVCEIDDCDYKCWSLDYMRSHMCRRHGIGKSDRQCTRCDKAYFSDRQLAAHVRNRHGKTIATAGQASKCAECGETFESNSTLQTHRLKAHGKGRLFACEECDFKSPRKKDVQAHSMARHKRSARGVKVYQCAECDYKCVDRSRFEEHSSTHNRSVKTYACSACSKSYSTRRGLRTHVKYHSDVRPHRCDRCVAQFKDGSKLRDHVRLLHTHAGLKPYKCAYCGHVTALRGNCNQHIRRHHPGLSVVVVSNDDVIDRVVENSVGKRPKTKEYNYANLGGKDVVESHDIGAATWAQCSMLS